MNGPRVEVSWASFKEATAKEVFCFWVGDGTTVKEVAFSALNVNGWILYEFTHEVPRAEFDTWLVDFQTKYRRFNCAVVQVSAIRMIDPTIHTT